MATQKQIEAAFLSGVRGIVDNASYSMLRDALRRGDYDAALSALDIDNSAFDDLRGLLLQTYAEGGVDATGQKWPVNVRWNSATPQAEDYARNIVGRNITVITDDMRDAVRWTIGDGIALGRSRDRIALDIVGRVGANGKRTGGIVGLNRQQTIWVNGGYIDGEFKLGMRQYLENGDLAAYKRMALRDKRFDKMVSAAMASGRKLTAAQIDRITQQYANKQLLSRGRAIAMTERGLAINMGRMEGYRQAAAKLGIPVAAMMKEWLHIGVHKDERIYHVAASGMTVRGLNTPFYLANGAVMQHPHDPLAPAGEVINCNCQVRVTLPRNWRAYRGTT